MVTISGCDILMTDKRGGMDLGRELKKTAEPKTTVIGGATTRRSIQRNEKKVLERQPQKKVGL